MGPQSRFGVTDQYRRDDHAAGKADALEGAAHDRV